MNERPHFQIARRAAVAALLRKEPVVLTEFSETTRCPGSRFPITLIQLTDLGMKARKCDACLNMVSSRMLTCALLAQ